MNHGALFAPSVRFEFWAPMRPRTRCQPNSARLPRTSGISLHLRPPSLPSLSSVSAHLEITYLSRALSHTLHIFEQLSPRILPGLGITLALSHPHLFVSRSAVLSVFQRRHIQSTRAPCP